MRESDADLVIVGAGTVGGWASYFAIADGAKKVIVIDSDVAGHGASSRAAGMVRAQGGTPETSLLGKWSIDFYKHQQKNLGTDSGFRELGYLLLAATEQDVKEGQDRVVMQQQLGLDVKWLSPDEIHAVNPTLRVDGYKGASYLATDGCIDPPRNVRAYVLAMHSRGVELRENTGFLGLETAVTQGGQSSVTGVNTSSGLIKTARVILTGGPTLRHVGKLAGIRIPAGGTRHHVAITAPHPAFQVERQSMVFDITKGLYWRLEEGGLLFGIQNPNEKPGPALEIDWSTVEQMKQLLYRLVPITEGIGLKKVWVGTIDYTPDHLPILGPGLTNEGEPITGVTIASAGGHGMMWGPAVARIASDLALQGKTSVVDITNLGLDRFDEHGNSRMATDPIALPFPIETA